MVDVGNDEDFGGLHPIMLETEPERRPATEGGNYVTAATDTAQQQATQQEVWRMDLSFLHDLQIFVSIIDCIRKNVVDGHHVHL